MRREKPGGREEKRKKWRWSSSRKREGEKKGRKVWNESFVASLAAPPTSPDKSRWTWRSCRLWLMKKVKVSEVYYANEADGVAVVVRGSFSPTNERAAWREGVWASLHSHDYPSSWRDRRGVEPESHQPTSSQVLCQEAPPTMWLSGRRKPSPFFYSSFSLRLTSNSTSSFCLPSSSVSRPSLPPLFYFWTPFVFFSSFRPSDRLFLLFCPSSYISPFSCSFPMWLCVPALRSSIKWAAHPAWWSCDQQAESPRRGFCCFSEGWFAFSGAVSGSAGRIAGGWWAAGGHTAAAQHSDAATQPTWAHAPTPLLIGWQQRFIMRSPTRLRTEQVKGNWWRPRPPNSKCEWRLAMIGTDKDVSGLAPPTRPQLIAAARRSPWALSPRLTRTPGLLLFLFYFFFLAALGSCSEHIDAQE